MLYRPFEARDQRPVYHLFRDSLWQFMLQNGMATTDDRNDIDAAWAQQSDFYLHLERTAAEDWVAESSDGAIVGWARSVERDDHLQLTHFFVDPATQGQGVGRALLDRAFPVGRGRQRSIIASTNPSALSLYQRYGVSFQGMAYCVCGSPQARDLQGVQLPEAAATDDTTLAQILAVDREVLGYERRADLEFLLQRQPAFLLRQDGQTVGYAFGSNAHEAGPAAALDPADLPPLIQAIERSAIEAGRDELWLTIPANAHIAVEHLLTSGYRIDPFYEFLLAARPELQLDRYILTECSFIW